MTHAPILVVASRNPGKLREIHALLAPHGIDVRSVADLPGVDEVDETGTTFSENAALKASCVARQVVSWTLGEDSGLTVDALDGRPGDFSARFAGAHGDDAANNTKLVEELTGVPDDKRGAGYVCAIAVANPQGDVVLTEQAVCRGRIVSEPRGTNGFGYDPHVLIPEYHQTFGELPAVVKQHLSHRARAFERLLPRLIAALKQA